MMETPSVNAASEEANNWDSSGEVAADPAASAVPLGAKQDGVVIVVVETTTVSAAPAPGPPDSGVEEEEGGVGASEHERRARSQYNL